MVFLVVSPSTTEGTVKKLCRHSFSAGNRVVLLRGFAQFPCLRSVCPLRHFGECCQRVRSGVSTERTGIAVCKTPTMCPPCCVFLTHWHQNVSVVVVVVARSARLALFSHWKCHHTTGGRRGRWRGKVSVFDTFKYFTHGEKQNKNNSHNNRKTAGLSPER